MLGHSHKIVWEPMKQQSYVKSHAPYHRTKGVRAGTDRTNPPVQTLISEPTGVSSNLLPSDQSSFQDATESLGDPSSAAIMCFCCSKYLFPALPEIHKGIWIGEITHVLTGLKCCVGWGGDWEERFPANSVPCFSWVWQVSPHACCMLTWPPAQTPKPCPGWSIDLCVLTSHQLWSS